MWTGIWTEAFRHGKSHLKDSKRKTTNIHVAQDLFVEIISLVWFGVFFL